MLGWEGTRKIIGISVVIYLNVLAVFWWFHFLNVLLVGSMAVFNGVFVPQGWVLRWVVSLLPNRR